MARHGETIWHSENRYAGSSDIELTEKGVAQSHALGEWSSSHGITHIYSSPLLRAVHTATPTASRLHLPLRQDSRLREVHFGSGEGLTTDEMSAQFPDALRAFRHRPASSPLPGGESGAEAIDRVWPAIQDIVKQLVASGSGRETVEKKALIVMHSTLMRLVLCKVLEIPLDNYRRAFPLVRNVAITSILLPDGDEKGASLLSYNSTT
ncbi:histidine phosphatase family protein [Subtercola boreus]|uniref:histidine phosphatase family protein n=1 Tax=Subtercola boreus TaxID=120213 RepID=UPI001C0EB134|nr:histidine phosphatase family protein [Subtercola boreus]